MRTSLDNAGRIELPEFVRAQLGVKSGDELALEEENGKWFITPARPSANDPIESLNSGDARSEASSPLGHPLADAHDDHLDWEDLDCDAVPLERAGQVTVLIQHRGQLKPITPDLNPDLRRTTNGQENEPSSS